MGWAPVILYVEMGTTSETTREWDFGENKCEVKMFVFSLMKRVFWFWKLF